MLESQIIQMPSVEGPVTLKVRNAWRRRILIVVGTRPEAIKLAPLILALRAAAWAEVEVLATGQHRELLADALADFAIAPDSNLDIMRPGQALSGVAARILDALDARIAASPPDCIVVQGDTTTVMAAGLEGVLAERHQLAQFTSLRGYLTGDRPVSEPLLATFAVRAVMPLDVKRLRRWLRERQIGQLEIKNRGTSLDLPRLRRQLKLEGADQAVLLVAAQPGSTLALIADRWADVV